MNQVGRILLIFVAVFAFTTTSFYVYLEIGLPDVKQVEQFRPNGSLQMTARDGTVIYTTGDAPRERAKAQDIPKVLKQALIASEDRRFYEHNGVDMLGIGRAILNNFREGELVEGGSTITQQLARILFLNRDKNLGRKLQEAILALKLEQNYSKEDLLLFYLNYSYYGAGAYGVADASRVYFNKSVRNLTLTEAATLIGVLPAPSIYSPLNNPSLARKRRDQVLKKMVLEKMITEQSYRGLSAATPKYKFSPTNQQVNAYFTTYVQSLLPNLLDPDRLEAGGLVIETTLDPKAQRLAQASLQRYVNRRVKQGAIVTLNPKNGEVLALVGGVDFRKSQFNRATQALRQPGSAFKMFVYLTALESGIEPSQVYTDQAMRVGNYQPKNADGQFLGDLTLSEAIAKSRNPIAVQLLLEVGINKVIATCRRLGLTTPLREDASLALGASEVRLLEFTRAYGVLANGGTKVDTLAVRRIRDRAGKLLYEAKPNAEQVIEPATAWTMTEMLRYAVTNGTGRATRVKFDAAGKTGTSDLGRDLLFMGYTPNLVTGVWMGNDDDRPTGSSSSLAARVWGDYMGRLVGKTSPNFVAPPGSELRESSDIIPTPPPSRPSRPSELTTSNLPEPEVSTEPNSEENTDIPEPEEEDRFTESALEDDPDCYERSNRNRDARCRNRKN